MLGIMPAGQAFAAMALAIWGLVATPATGVRASDSTLCSFQVAAVSGGAYNVQNNEWGSSAPECVTTDGGADFTVSSSSISEPTNGAPGGYPSIVAGCHWGNCTASGLGTHPLALATIGTDLVTSSWNVTTPGGSGNAYDVAYDIWINQTPTTSVAANGTEIMVWLADHGSVQPAGSLVASGVRIGGYDYNVWYGASNGTSDIVSYQMTSQRSEVTSLNIGNFIIDAEQRGYTAPSWYLISVEAGFEIWQGGTGLATNSFSVNVRTGLRRWPPLGTGSAPPPGAQPDRH